MSHKNSNEPDYEYDLILKHHCDRQYSLNTMEGIKLYNILALNEYDAIEQARKIMSSFHSVRVRLESEIEQSKTTD